KRRALGPGLQVVRPHHRADARRAIGKRDEPEPAVLEPEHGDIAFVAARVAFRATEMAVKRGTVVLVVAALGLEVIREQGVTARRIHHETGPAVLFATVVMLRVNHSVAARCLATASIAGQECDVAHAT